MASHKSVQIRLTSDGTRWGKTIPGSSTCDRFQRHAVIWLIAGCLLAAGCSSKDGLARVTGKVTLNGRPLSDARIEFRPVAVEAAPSSGLTDADGCYELEYTFDTPGAIPGEHVVSIRTSGTYFDEQGNEREQEEQLPARYNARSELRRTVEPGKNRIDFDL